MPRRTPGPRVTPRLRVYSVLRPGWMSSLALWLMHDLLVPFTAPQDACMLIVRRLDHWLWHHWWQTCRICASAPHSGRNRKQTLDTPAKRGAIASYLHISRSWSILTVHVLTVLAVSQEGIKNGIPGAHAVFTKALNLACILPF